MDTQKLEKDMYKSADILKELFEQMETTKSSTLKDLLEKEINAYFALQDAFSETVETFKKFSDELHNDIPSENLMVEEAIEAAKSAKTLPEQVNARNRLLQVRELLNQMNILQMSAIISCDECSEIYLYTISRDYKIWGKLAEELGKVAAKFSVGLVPMLSEVSHILGTAKEIADIVEKYSHSVPDYSETDKQLEFIEIHIQIMEKTIDFFGWVTEQIPSWNDPEIQQPHKPNKA